MRCILAFLEWKAAWWTEEGGRNLDVRPDIADSICAYAAKQTLINHALACSFKMHWESTSKSQCHHMQGKTNLTDGNEYTGKAEK